MMGWMLLRVECCAGLLGSKERRWARGKGVAIGSIGEIYGRAAVGLAGPAEASRADFISPATSETFGELLSKNPNAFLIAALCAAHARGTPRKCPENCLKIEGREVLLWDTAIEGPCFAVSLRFWHA
jgi:hypothetical protein